MTNLAVGDIQKNSRQYLVKRFPIVTDRNQILPRIEPVALAMTM